MACKCWNVARWSCLRNARIQKLGLTTDEEVFRPLKHGGRNFSFLSSCRRSITPFVSSAYGECMLGNKRRGIFEFSLDIYTFLPFSVCLCICSSCLSYVSKVDFHCLHNTSRRGGREMIWSRFLSHIERKPHNGNPPPLLLLAAPTGVCLCLSANFPLHSRTRCQLSPRVS